jgi:hypothetical protein
MAQTQLTAIAARLASLPPEVLNALLAALGGGTEARDLAPPSERGIGK